MTDTTDIKALQRPTRKHYDWSKAVWMDCDRCGEAHTGTVLADDGARICAGCCDSEYFSAWEDLAETAIKLLEAERQRADDAERAGDNARSSRDLHHKVSAGLNDRLIKAEAELAALKGDQVPVGYLSESLLKKLRQGNVVSVWPVAAFGETIKLFTHPQKPVVLPPLANIHSNWSGEYLDKAGVIAAIEAAGGIVKDGE